MTVLKIGDKIRMSELGESGGIPSDIIPIGTIGTIEEFYDMNSLRHRHVRVAFDIDSPHNAEWYYTYDDAVIDLVQE